MKTEFISHKTKKKTTRLGIGGAPCGGHGWGKRDDIEAMNALLTCIDNDIRLFDTADCYGLGNAEKILGKAIKESKISREVLTICTKGGVAWTSNGKTYKNSTSKYLKNAVEDSLKRLAIDYIDTYYLHWTDGITPIEESIDALVTLKKEGKIQSIGVSNLNIDEFNKLQKKDIGAIQLKGNLLETNEIYKHIPYSRKLKASLILFSTLADGLLTGKFDVSTKFDNEDHRNKYPLFEKNKFLECLEKIKLIKNLIKDYGATIPQVSLRWLLETEGVDAVLFGSISSKNIKENLKCFDINFDDELYKYLKELIPLNP